MLLYQRYFLICPSRQGRNSDPHLPVQETEAWEGNVPLKFTWVGTGSINPQTQGSVSKPRAPSKSPTHLLPEALLTSKIPDTDQVCP